MIDLHCHILPAIDDGPKTMSESLVMAKFAVESGISHILCSPHHNNGQYDNGKKKVLDQVAILQKALVKEKIPLRIYEGQEIRVSYDLFEKFEKNELLTVDLERRYLLIEFPDEDIPPYVSSLFIKMIGRGLTPIIVHPERNKIIGRDIDRLIPFLEMGCLAQLTAPSYVGMYGKKIQRIAKKMVSQNMIQMIASDAHGLDKRPFVLKEAYQKIQKDFGKEKIENMQQVAKDILNGDLVVASDYKKSKSKIIKFWRK